MDNGKEVPVIDAHEDYKSYCFSQLFVKRCMQNFIFTIHVTDKGKIQICV